MDMLLALVFRVTEPPREISANTISEKTKKELKLKFKVRLEYVSTLHRPPGVISGSVVHCSTTTTTHDNANVRHNTQFNEERGEEKEGRVGGISI